MFITAKQYNLLQGFYAHCYCVYHDNVIADFGFWASQLDSSGVPWSVQNTVAVTAEDKGSISLYLRTHLAKKDIRVH